MRYHLRDWCISRQRYWGPPIPMVHCTQCGIVPVPEEQLPVALPYLKQFEPDGSGVSPLGRDAAFVNTTCPACGAAARRETDVSDNFLCSSWYFLRYLSPGRTDGAFDAEAVQRWCPVDMYIGGNEHAVLHLMYTRFVCMALHDIGLVPFEEPFTRFRAHGLIIKDGAKMSKSRGNVINPDEYFDRWGADVLRTFLMFLGPYQQGGDFRDKAISGISRFYLRLWGFVTEGVVDSPPGSDACTVMQGYVNRVTDDIAHLRYNTAIARLMELLRWARSLNTRHRAVAEALVRMAAPFGPYVCHELWQRMGHDGMVCDAPWPAVTDTAPVEHRTVGVKVDGRMRGRVEVPGDCGEAEVIGAARAHHNVAAALANRSVVRTVCVPGRLVNFVTRSIEGDADG